MATKLYIENPDGTRELISNPQTVDAAVMVDRQPLNEYLKSKAPLHSPALSGIPSAPTSQIDDNGSAISNTEFVQKQVVYMGPEGNYHSLPEEIKMSGAIFLTDYEE